VAVLLFLKNKEQQVEISEITEQMAFEKEMLEDEFQDFASQFDGYQIPEIQNDSLVELLVKEKQRVQDLLEELRITKATDARRIAQLKKELATVRAVMVTYVQQIDSLDRTNKQLVQENQQVKQQYHVVSREAAQLKQERSELSEKVTRAQMLDMSHFAFTPLNKRDRKAKAFAQASRRGWEWAHENPRETVSIVMKVIKNENMPASRQHQEWMLKEVLKLQLDKETGNPTFELDEDKIELINEFLLVDKRINKAVKKSQIIGE
jgi:hypothetical protein